MKGSGHYREGHRGDLAVPVSWARLVLAKHALPPPPAAPLGPGTHLLPGRYVRMAWSEPSSQSGPLTMQVPAAPATPQTTQRLPLH